MYVLEIMYLLIKWKFTPFHILFHWFICKVINVANSKLSIKRNNDYLNVIIHTYTKLIVSSLFRCSELRHVCQMRLDFCERLEIRKKTNLVIFQSRLFYRISGDDLAIVHYYLQKVKYCNIIWTKAKCSQYKY